MNQTTTLSRSLNRPTQVQRGRIVGLLMLTMAALGGCAAQPVSVAWSHAMSGDYLFAYDQSGCAQAAGSEIAPEFYACMEDLGYFQIDPESGAALDTPAVSAATAAVTTSAAR